MEFHKDNTIPPKGWIWVFGSNLGGRHGAGAAAVARSNFGAQYGQGVGRTGDAYGIPTKDRSLNVLSLDVIEPSINAFLQYARENPKLKFFVTRIGCGLAHFKDETMAPFFVGAPDNCSMPEEWKAYLG